MNTLIGTSGFAYKEWKGTFYPDDLPADAMLGFYAAHFRAVEINNTFYRMPAETVLRNWAEQVPPEFRFVLKSPRSITHSSRLKDVADKVSYLVTTAAALGDQLGPILFQLPPNMKQDVTRLETFLGTLGPDVRAALEFRHPSWYDETTFAALRSHNAALCIAETQEDAAPLVPTASWGYLRLRKVEYEADELVRWAAWIPRQSWSDTFVFFKHEDAGTGPRLAKQLMTLLDTG
jgi:uncharacterized protein YecE (DUF72 family)